MAREAGGSTAYECHAGLECRAVEVNTGGNSLVTIVGLYDLLTAATVATTDPEWRPYFAEVYVFAGLMFWIFCFSMSRYSQWLERLANRYNRR